MFSLTRCMGRRALSTTRILASTREPLASLSAADGTAKNTLVEKSGHEDLNIAHISDTPAELREERVVRIFQMAPPPTQSGFHQSRYWRIDWDVVNVANRWEDHLIGYASSADYMQGTQMQFRSREDAVAFATRQGWDYYIQEPHKRDIKAKQYAENFVHVPGKLKHIRTK